MCFSRSQTDMIKVCAVAEPLSLPKPFGRLTKGSAEWRGRQFRHPGSFNKVMVSSDASFLFYRYIYLFPSLSCNVSFCDDSTINRLNNRNCCPHCVIWNCYALICCVFVLPCYESVILQNDLLSMRPEWTCACWINLYSWTTKSKLEWH